MVSPKRLPSDYKGEFPLLLAHLHLLTHTRLLLHLCRLVHPGGASSPRATRNERCGTISHAIGQPGGSLSLPPGLDLSSMTNPGTPPEHLVVAAQKLPSVLPVGCEMFGEDDLDVAGSHRISVGGFADVWMGKMNNGATVAIKSYRCYSSSSCFPVYQVNVKRYRMLCPLKVTQSGCTMKRWRVVTSAAATATRVSSRSWGFIPPRSTHSPSFLSSWITRTSANI